MIFIFIAYLILVSVIDYKTKIISDGVTLLGIIVVLNYQLFCGNIWMAVLGINAGIAVIWISNLIKTDKFGGADAKLMACIGAFAGWQVTLAVALGAKLLFLPFKYWGKQKTLPYAPFITVSFIIVKLCIEIFYLKS